ncbi:MAG: hypothetical protein HY716_16010 [Planctomycetes bacterium]|nr:hypothetical protein [Planctomycetota bacterium]
MQHRRGLVLIVVLVALALLALLGVSFSELSALDRRVSAGYLDEVRARLVARSGVERAVAEVQSAVRRDPGADLTAMQYWGGNDDEAGSPDWETPLKFATNPSYAYEDEKRQHPDDPHMRPMRFEIDGQEVGISGTLMLGTYAPHGDVYRLLVADANSRIHVNDGIEHGKDGNVSRNLRRILNVLKYNARINAYRYGRSVSSDALPIVTPLVFAPDFADPLSGLNAVMALDELHAPWIERCRRAPVNVNLASREVLTALIAGLRGWFLVGRRQHNPSSGMYAFLNHQKYDNTPGGKKGDEIGFLYATAHTWSEIPR